MIHWALFTILGTGLFYGLYLLLLRRDHRLQLSRDYLIVTLAFCLVFPFLHLPAPLTASPSTGRTTAVAIDPLVADGLSETEEPTANLLVNLDDVFPSIYLFGLAVTLAVLLFQLVTQTISILMLRRKYTVRTAADGFNIPRTASLLLIPDNTPPCSFCNHIFIGTNGLNDEQLQCIIAHEALHVRQWHTLDVLMVRLICCIAWFNPFAWLYVRELRAVHEYLADDAVLSAHGREGYLGLLYREATGLGYGHITNNFQSINIKKRIAMMNRKKTRFGAWKLLAALPVAALLMMVGCKPAVAAPATDGYSNPLLIVNYHREGGKQQPFGRTCYNRVGSEVINKQDLPLIFKVTCSGEGSSTSYGTWDLSEFHTSKGLVANGHLLTRYEKKLIKAVDHQLRIGKAEGSLSRATTVRAYNGSTRLTFTARWRNGKPNGDADITLTISEVGSATVPPADATIYDVPDTDPEFVGGTEALYRYLAANIHYPEQAKKDSIQGRVFVRFTVEADGSISEATVLRGIGGGCDEEALSVVKAMPRWKPGTKDGKPVRVQYNLPIVFKLNEQ